jgi:hypothetical protein
MPISVMQRTRAAFPYSHSIVQSNVGRLLGNEKSATATASLSAI